MAGESAVRRRRVRVFEVFATFLLLFCLLFAALYWSDFSASPGVSVSYVDFESTDGVRIAGAIFKKASLTDLEPGVVVVHGLTSYKENLNRLSVELARHDFVVLAIDLRDHGSSTGVCTFGLPDAEPEDVAHAVEFLREQPGVDSQRMAIVGHSFGGMVALTAASKASTQVNATVTWGAPTDLQKLDQENHETVAFVADKRVLPQDILEPQQLAVRSPITYIAGLRPNSTLFIHGLDDTLIPPDQAVVAFNLTQRNGQLIELLPGLNHDLDSLGVVERTIGFIELKTRGAAQPPIDPVYPAFRQDASTLAFLLAVLNLPVAWLSWEFWCTRESQRVRLYTFYAEGKPLFGWAFGVADVVVFGAVVFAAGLFVAPGARPLLFSGVLPAPSLFSAVLLAGLGLVACVLPLSRVERFVRGRDDRAFEEGENLTRSLLVVLPVLGMILVGAALAYLLFLGYNAPRSATFLLPAGLLILVMLGFEAFLRLRVQRRLRGIVTAVAPSAGLLRSAVNVLVGSVLYFAMVTWALAWVFRGYASVPGDAIAFTVAIGLVSSLLYDRTKSIVPGALFSGIYVAWVLNSAFHF